MLATDFCYLKNLFLVSIKFIFFFFIFFCEIFRIILKNIRYFLVQDLYETMNKCQVENPDLDDDQISEKSDEEENQEMIGSNGDLLSDSGHWFTADTSTDEIYLSAEGRANLERMLGNLNEGNSSKFFV